jgi:hypothetical protein
MDEVLALIELLLKANPKVITYAGRHGDNSFHSACKHLKGESGAAILSLLSTRYSDIELVFTLGLELRLRLGSGLG